MHTLLFADLRSKLERGSACSNHSIKKEDDSSQSSTCVVDTTTRGCSEEAATWRGLHPEVWEGRGAGTHPKPPSPPGGSRALTESSRTLQSLSGQRVTHLAPLNPGSGTQ